MVTRLKELRKVCVRGLGVEESNWLSNVTAKIIHTVAPKFCILEKDGKRTKRKFHQSRQ